MTIARLGIGPYESYLETISDEEKLIWPEEHEEEAAILEGYRKLTRVDFNGSQSNCY